MKTVAVLCLFVALSVLSANCLPISEILEEDSQDHIRVKRFTCDVLGIEAFGIKINSAACAAHCIGHGRRGGYCNSKGVCVCR